MTHRGVDLVEHGGGGERTCVHWRQKSAETEKSHSRGKSVSRNASAWKYAEQSSVKGGCRREVQAKEQEKYERRRDLGASRSREKEFRG